MKSSFRAALALGALALASAQASASTVNLSAVGQVKTVSDTLQINSDPLTFANPGWMQVNVSGNVTGAVFNLNDTASDGYTVNYQLYAADQATALGAGWSFTDIGTAAQNLAQAGVYRALSAGTYFVGITFADGDANAFHAITQVSAVPLPGAALLFGSALMGLGALRRKQKAGVASEMAAA